MADDNPSIINHVSLAVSDAKVSLPFYDSVLGAVGASRVMEDEYAVAYGKAFPEFWVQLVPYDGGKLQTANGVHFSFTATSEDQVQAFHEAALATGGTDDGAPGPRPAYGPAYYGCFVRDPDGHKLEAMFWDDSKA